MESKKSLSIKLFIIMFGILVIVISCLFLVISNKDSKVTITTKSELVKVLDISELASAEYIYNGIATMMKKDNKVAYYVSYNGKVRAGIDIKKIKYEEDTKHKKIIVTLPDIEILDVVIDASHLDFIFLDKSYNTEIVHQEAFNLAKQALENTTQTDKEFYEKARENIKYVVRASIEPLIDAKDNEYELEVK